jgi:hypothetical protein
MAPAQQTAPVSNQSTGNQSTGNQSAPDAVGPRELQNFKLPGTVTRPTEQPATTAPAGPAQTPSSTSSTNRPEAGTPSAPRAPARRPSTAASSDAVSPRAGSTPEAAPLASAPTAATPVPLPTTSFPPPGPAVQPAPASPAVPLYAWLLAAALLAAGAGAFLLRRRDHARYALAGADEDDATPPVERVTAPAPSPPAALPPAPATAASTNVRSAPPPTPAAPAAPTGIVSTRLRPWLEIGFNPVRCVLDEAKATLDFELELFNSGSAPARNVILAATAFNAGPAQDATISAYFEQPSGQGHAVDPIPPMERTVVPLQLTMPRDQLQPYELGGHQVFIPLLAATTTYAWRTGDGQTSASYLIGRGTAGDKLAPFRIDAGPRIFRGLGARPLPVAVRR